MSTIQRKCLCKSEHVTTYFIWIFTQVYHRKLWKIRIVSDIHVSDSNTFFHLHNTVSTAYTSTTNVMFWNFFSSFKKKMKKPSHLRFPYHETVILLNFVCISFLFSYLLCISSWTENIYIALLCGDRFSTMIKSVTKSWIPIYAKLQRR